MKRKTFMLITATVFALLFMLELLCSGLPTYFSSIAAAPFEQLAVLLSVLAQTGSVGNGFALSLCAAISLLPLCMLRRERPAENAVLCCMSAAVFAALFVMAKPSALASVFSYVTQEAMPIAKGVVGTMVWSIVILWLILRLVRLLKAGDTNALLRYLRTALYVLCLLFAAAAAISCGGALADSLSVAQQGANRVMALLRFAVSVLPYAFDIAVTLSLLSLLDAYIAGDEDSAAKSAATLSKRCCTALGVTAAAVAGLNVLQLLLARFISNVAVSLDIPVVSLVFVLLLLILSRLVFENRKLKNDNDLFI